MLSVAINDNANLLTCIDVLYHLNWRECKSAISNLHEALTEGGFFVFTDNYLHVGPTTKHREHHTKMLIYQELSSAGFEIIHEQPFTAIMNGSDSLWWRSLQFVMHWLTKFGFGWTGWIIGALLYPFERILVAMGVRMSSSIFVCQKISE